MTDSIINAVRSHSTNTAESVLSDLAYAVQGLRKVQTMTPDQRERLKALVASASVVFLTIKEPD